MPVQMRIAHGGDLGDALNELLKGTYMIHGLLSLVKRFNNFNVERFSPSPCVEVEL